MIKKELIGKLSKIKLFITDVDGTLTDSAMYYSSRGEELKRFSTRDGMGITLLQKAGIDTAIVTSEQSEIARSRAEKLKIRKIILGCRNKSEAVSNLARELNISLEEIAYIGDDVNDLEVMKIIGVSACPIDAVTEIKKIADYICIASGGNGAVREFSELILNTQNKSVTLTENW